MWKGIKMEFLKVLFENGAVTWDQFAKGVKDKGLKIADLSEDNYVSKQKYDNDVHTKDTQIETLNKNIKTRDDDLEDLKNQLEAAGNDKVKLKELTGKFNTLQTDYNTAKTDYEGKLQKQRYEFAVKEFAHTQTFTSAAAKREFIRSMTENELNMDNETILGANDFLEKYKKENADSFATDNDDKKPKFAEKSGGGQGKTNDPFLNGFDE